jgi:hypothetical protein
MNAEYWNSFYSKNTVTMQPSGFFMFVLDWLANNGYASGHSVVDIGCGNMRDSLAFAENGYRVIALDLSTSIGDSPHKNITVIDGYDVIGMDIKSSIYYCRFLVHSMEENYFDRFLKNIHTEMNASSVLFIETRAASADKDKEKILFQSSVGDGHYRYLYSKSYLMEKFQALGFVVDFVAEGEDMAIYEDENPKIIRVILRRKTTEAEYANNVKAARKLIKSIRTPDFVDRQKKILSVFKRAAVFLDSNHVTYWLGYGSLIGCLRHGGMVPWDDDIDLCVNEDGLAKLMSLDVSTMDFTFRQLNDVHFFIDSGFIADNIALGLDVFLNVETDPKNFSADEIFPLAPAKFNGITTYIPNKTDGLLRRRYGITDLADCVIWNHHSGSNYWEDNFEPHRCVIRYDDLPKRLKMYRLKFT